MIMDLPTHNTQVQPSITSYISHERDSRRGILKSKRIQSVVASLTGKEGPATVAPPTRKRKRGGGVRKGNSQSNKVVCVCLVYTFANNIIP